MSKKLTPRQRYGARWQMAAQMVAKGEKTRQQIKDEIHVSAKTLADWEYNDAEFIAEVERLKFEIRQGLIEKGIADKANRIAKYEDLIHRMYQVIEGRASGQTAALVDGGASGLIAHDVKFSRLGDPIDIGRFDKALVSEIREVLKQAAIEVGDWNEKATITNVDVGTLTDEQLERIANGEPVERVVAGSRRD